MDEGQQADGGVHLEAAGSSLPVQHLWQWRHVVLSCEVCWTLVCVSCCRDSRWW